jgi:hypothetical protein
VCTHVEACIGSLHAQLFLPIIAVPGLRLLFPHDCVCRGGACEGGSSEEEVSLSEKVVLVFLTVETRCR